MISSKGKSKMSECFQRQSRKNFEFCSHKNCTLTIIDILNSGVLLQEIGSHDYHSFSNDGNTFGAFAGDHLSTWKYASGHYTQWRKFQQAPTPIQFSPNSSSILGCAGVLHIVHMDYSTPIPTTNPKSANHPIPKDAYPPDGSYIATTYLGESTVTIINLQSQNPSSQFIDTDLEIAEIILTGSVLLVKGSDTLVAWLLTEEGVVNGVDNRRANRNDSLWSMSLKDMALQNLSPQDRNPSFWTRLLQVGQDKHSNGGHLEFSVWDGIAAVGYQNYQNASSMHTYHIGTGEVLKPDRALLHHKHTWYRFYNPHRDDCELYHQELAKHHKLLEGDLLVSQSTFKDGWVKDAEGRHTLWLYPHWRATGNNIDWFDKVKTLRVKNLSKLVIIKF